MSTQLELITSDPRPDGGGRTVGSAAKPASTGGSGRSKARRSRPAPPRRSGTSGWLDRRTIETGRQGLAAARAALGEANRRAAARREEQLRRRQEDLERMADVARHPAGRRAA